MDATALLKQVLRYAKTSGIVAQGAVRMASENMFGHANNHDVYAQTLTQALGELKGPVMKIAQFLATVPGALPDEYAQAFAVLQTNAPPMHSGFVRRRMQHEIGPTWHNHFQSFDLTPRFAASLGQVHYGVLKTGEPVACKLQYPDMETIVNADLNQLKLVLSVYEMVNKAIKTQGLFDEIREKLLEELDYTQEATWAQMYHSIFKDDESIYIPKIYPELSTHRLLTMEWVEGKPILSFTSAPIDVRNHIAKQLFCAWYRPLYHYGMIHGDPHPGNYHVNTNGGLNLLDFGCVRAFSGDFIMGVINLYRSFQNNDKDLRYAAYTSWGFEKLSSDMVEILDDWAKMLLDPLLDNRVRPIQERIEGWDIASKIHQKLHKLGGVRPPREFVFMDRAAVGIGSVLFHLKSELNWHTLFESLIEGVSALRIDAARQSLIS